MKGLRLFITAVAALALLIVPASALAKRGDRDHDRMADKWERRHQLNPRANDARRDPDHDGLRNLSEFRHHTDPHDADTDDDGLDDEQELEHHMSPDDRDTDDDGIGDDDELSGTVASFDGTTLVIQLAGDGAGTVTGTVNADTRINCDDDGEHTATAARDGADAPSGDDRSGPGDGSDGSDDDNSGPGSTSSGEGDGTTTSSPTPDDNSGPGSTNSGDDDDQAGEACTIAVGDLVHEAKLVTSDSGNTFTKVELIK
jgi:hypothetical protein